MKRHLSLFLVGLVTGLSPMLVNGQVSLSADIQVGPANIQINSPNDFYQPLSSYGNWVDVGSYGRCWHPRDVAGDWQPYVNGQWVYTDAGWYWQSDEPWGWATCHYGSWVNDPSYGWCWIPGTEWAPAWVTWRTGDDYVGWAPIGPNRSVLAPSLFVFTGIHDFGRAFHGRGDFERDNPTIINRTRVMNDFSTRNVNIDGREKRISYNRGPAVENIQRATGKTFQARPVTDVVRERHQPTNLRQNNHPQQPQERNGYEQQPNRDQQLNREEQQNREQRPGTPQTYQPTPNRTAHPEARPATPEQRQIQPTGREHGYNTPSQQPEAVNPSQPRTPDRSQPPATRPSTERPTPQPMAPREGQAPPPTGKEHGVSMPPQQHEVPTPAQPAQPNRSERPTPKASAPEQQRQIQPTGQEHGTSFPSQQRETAHPEATPKAEQAAPHQEKAAQPEQQHQQQQQGKDQRTP